MLIFQSLLKPAYQFRITEAGVLGHHVSAEHAMPPGKQFKTPVWFVVKSCMAGQLLELLIGRARSDDV